MLIRLSVLERIKTGEVTLAFRKWRCPTVKAGGTLKTAVGLLKIKKIEIIKPSAISEANIKAAGYQSRAELLKEIGPREGELYKITIAFAGEDPRNELRANTALSKEELLAITNRLERLDNNSQLGAWTRVVMMAINQNPKLRAVELARKTGFAKDWLKINVRKLKNLGLTISHKEGYTLSPRGKKVLNFIKKRS